MIQKIPTINLESNELPAHLRGAVVAIGNFDGFHRGHRAVIDEALSCAKRLNKPAIILTFSPHPRTWFNPKEPVYLLSPNNLRAKLAQKLKFDAMVVHRFDKKFSSLSAEEFIHNILIEKLGAAHIVAGHDFHFGAKRSGNPKYLEQAGVRLGFGVSLVNACHDENGEIISSSRIRQHLIKGEVAQANGLLGYAYQIEGEVIRGQKMGRKLGFPTANIELGKDVALKHGIYAVRAIRANGSSHDGVASFGRRPTFDNGNALFETNLFNFDEDLYGENLTVLLFAWLRSEQKFDKIEDLIVQMKRDKHEAEQYLMTLAPDHLRWPAISHIVDHA